MGQNVATTEAIGSATAADDAQEMMPLRSPPWNLFNHLRPFAPKHHSKEFKTSYQINPDIIHKWESAFVKTGIPAFSTHLLAKEKPPTHQPTFIHAFNGHAAIPILADTGAELLADYQKHQLKKHRKTLWKNLIVGPQKALRKLAKIKVNFSGLGALYGTDDFGHDLGGGYDGNT
ncbi:uncharacterized protein LOC129787910 [Lutzomyia longipalpis]|uniref:uncharacterized protein LOC129787910 n=1 Tax=Lutzomyia longipalpis TaxID=7200 RepID=UPI0024839EED|nr:uncharacterized protein LOC129787910 [Lutzomyia longipalpis]